MSTLGAFRRKRRGAAMIFAALGIAGCASRPAPITRLVNGQVVSTRSINPDAYEHAARAFAYEEQGEWQNAVDELRRALIFDDVSPDLFARLAEDLLRLDHVEEASEAVRSSLGIGVTVEGLVADAHVRLWRGDIGGAVAILERAVKMGDFAEDPDRAENAYLELAEAQIAALDVDEAARTLKQLRQSDPHGAAGGMRLAAVGWALGQFDVAQISLASVTSGEPGHVDALVTLAWLLAAQSRVPEARAAFDKAVERSEGALDVAAAYARFLLGTGDEKGARQLADELGGANVGSEFLAARIDLERLVGRPENAVALAREALKPGETPNEGDGFKDPIKLALGQALEGQKKLAEAAEAYRSVKSDSPVFFDARLREVALLLEEDKASGAAKVLDSIAGEGSSGSGIHAVELVIARATVQEKLGDAAGAAHRLDDHLARQPRSGRLVLARASLEERRGRWQGALDLVETFLKANPSNTEALNFWGFVAADHGHRLALARKRLIAALALEPASGAVLDSLGWAYFHESDWVRAAVFLEQAARIEPSDAEILSHLGQLYTRRSEKTAAAAAFRKALALDPENDARQKIEDLLRALEAPAK